MINKQKITSRQLRSNYKHIVQVPNGYLQRLLSCSQPFAYNDGVYGWNYDVYEIPGTNYDTILCVGYRAIGNIRPDYDLMREFDQLATQVIQDTTADYNGCRDQLDELLIEFAQRATGEL